MFLRRVTILAPTIKIRNKNNKMIKI
jgi:hypothetical protein